jgi:hypothetical protein
VWTAAVVLVIATAPLSLPAAGGGTIAGTIGSSAVPLSSAAALLLAAGLENAKKN